jgi:F0F1-type ATP synthase assembly protein I
MARAFKGPMALFGPEQRKQLRSANRVMAVGSEFGIATLIGLFGGSWLDRRFGTGPWLTVLGIALGMAAGIKSLMRLAPTPTKKNDPPSDRRDG